LRRESSKSRTTMARRVFWFRHHCDFVNREQARSAIFDYIECFYNRQRLHQTLGYVSPVQFEKNNGVCELNRP
jgi:transposase InsO family protein